MDEKLLPRRSLRIQNLTFTGGSSSIPSANVVHGDMQTHEKNFLRRSPRLNVTVPGVKTSPGLGVYGQDKLTDVGGKAHKKRKGKRVLKKGEDVVKLEFVEKAKRKKLDGNKRGKKVIDDDDDFVDDESISKSKIAIPRDKLIKRLRKLRMELVKANKSQKALEKKIEARFADVKKNIINSNSKFIKDIKLLLCKENVKGKLPIDNVSGEPSTKKRDGGDSNVHKIGEFESKDFDDMFSSGTEFQEGHQSSSYIC